MMNQVNEQRLSGRLGSADIRELKTLALSGVPSMLNREKQLFCYKLRRTETGLVQEGLSRRYTMMTLLGLQECANRGMQLPADIKQIFANMLLDTSWIDNLGDLGTLLWTCAALSPERVRDVSSSLEVEGALGRFPEASEGRTTEIAWFLSGLAHVHLAGLDDACFEAIAAKTFELLVNNQGAHGFFRHLARRATLAGVVRGRIGSFADQVYPIYALTQFGRAYGVPSAMQRAKACADAICRAQGELGQWWWHYDASTGRVAQRYPVYSVHQDGMAPMALFALGEAMKLDFSAPILKGLAWIYGDNELNRDLRDESAAVIWRSIYRPKDWKKYRDEIGEYVSPGMASKPVENLTILFECRPYHLGWLLYAFAGRDGD